MAKAPQDDPMHQAVPSSIIGCNKTRAMNHGMQLHCVQGEYCSLSSPSRCSPLSSAQPHCNVPLCDQPSTATSLLMDHPGDSAVPVPYNSRLGQKLQPGQTLVVHGTSNADAKRFSINLLRGSSKIADANTDVILHLDVRFDQGKIVLNTKEGGTWGKEERVSNPFKAGQPFDLRIRCHEDKFDVSADHKEVKEFKYRLALAAIEFLTVEGDTTLSGVHWGGRYYNLPFETQFENGHLASGKRVFVYGTPKGDAFSVNFIARNGDVLFHYNPRLKEKKVVRNAEIDKVWGAEEREGPFPFKKDIGFDLVFLNEPYSIQVFHGGERLGTFAHRTKNPDNDYMGLRIMGDLELTGLEFAN